MNYADQWTVLSSISLQEGETRTLDCPFCGGRRKFSISKTDEGVTVWNCYRASCTSRGSRGGKRTTASLHKALQASSPTLVSLRDKPQTTVNHRVTPPPVITKNIHNDPDSLKYVTDNNCLEAYERDYINIRYAPAEKRTVFYNSLGTGCVGRSMAGHRSKWWAYGNTDGGIHVGEGDTAVLVEDVASACSVSRLTNHVGVALLGTSITEHIRNTLKRYNKLYIVLDNDASMKAITLSKSITGPISVRLTKRDLKYLGTNQIEEILR